MISIIMPCYNAERFIERTIQSVRNQTYKDWELLVIDDGSNDGSASIVENVINIDHRIRLIRQPNSGACRARNNGIENAKGEYTVFLDADDILLPYSLEEQVKNIASLGPKQIPFGDYSFIDENDNLIAEHQYTCSMQLLKSDQVEFFFREWQVLITCPLHRTALLREAGGFEETLPRGQESEMHLRLAVHDVEFVYFPIRLFYYRQYQAEQRISCHYLEKTKSKRAYWEIRNALVEKMFLKKYGDMPLKYRTYFRDAWYFKARRQFEENQIAEGKQSLESMKRYYPAKYSQRIYITVGKVVGYGIEEFILQLRLRLLGRNLK